MLQLDSQDLHLGVDLQALSTLDLDAFAGKCCRS